MEKEIRVAVIGIGNMGYAHASSIAQNQIKGMRLTAVCDENAEKLEFFKKSHSGVKCYKAYTDLFADNICEAVIIAVPHPLHAKIAISAFENGLNVLLEKPADISVSRVNKLNGAAKKSGKIFAIMFNQRTNPLFKTARDIVKNGDLGEIIRSSWTVTNWFRTQSYYDSGDWRATWSGEGGGVLLNQAPHNLDLWQWICGMPVEISAYCNVGKYHNIEVEDEATIFARYENGATGVFITSTGEYPGTNRLEICGDKGKLVLENGVLKKYILKAPISTVIANSQSGFDSIEYECEEIKQQAPETAHKGILQNFANALLYGEELIANGLEGINEITVSNAAYLSAWQNNAKIHLPFDENLYDNLLNEKIKNSKVRVKNDEHENNTTYLSRWQVRW